MSREPTTHPDGLDRLGRPLAALALCLALAASQCGCTSAATIAGVEKAVSTTIDILRTTRSIVCTTALDPMLGNPRDGEPEWRRVDKDASPATDAAAEGGAP